LSLGLSNDADLGTARVHRRRSAYQRDQRALLRQRRRWTTCFCLPDPCSFKRCPLLPPANQHTEVASAIPGISNRFQSFQVAAACGSAATKDTLIGCSARHGIATRLLGRCPFERCKPGVQSSWRWRGLGLMAAFASRIAPDTHQDQAATHRVLTALRNIAVNVRRAPRFAGSLTFEAGNSTEHNPATTTNLTPTSRAPAE
jgi:hypothetical protein